MADYDKDAFSNLVSKLVTEIPFISVILISQRPLTSLWYLAPKLIELGPLSAQQSVDVFFSNCEDLNKDKIAAMMMIGHPDYSKDATSALSNDSLEYQQSRKVNRVKSARESQPQ